MLHEPYYTITFCVPSTSELTNQVQKMRVALTFCGPLKGKKIALIAPSMILRHTLWGGCQFVDVSRSKSEQMATDWTWSQLPSSMFLHT